MESEKYLIFDIKAIIPSEIDATVYTCYLFNNSRKILLPICTNRWACESILIAKQKKTTVRPHIHNTFKRTLIAANIFFEGITLYKYFDDVFYAYISLKDVYDTTIEIDSKPTDAICLALLFDKKIKVAMEVCNQAGIKITKELLEKSLEE